MEKRITIQEMRDQLSSLVEEGHGDKFISVAEYYIGKKCNSEDVNSPWKNVYFEEIYYDDVPMTKEQEDFVREDMDKIKSEHPDLFKDLEKITF